MGQKEDSEGLPRPNRTAASETAPDGSSTIWSASNATFIANRASSSETRKAPASNREVMGKVVFRWAWGKVMGKVGLPMGKEV